MKNIKMKNLLAENMRRFGTKNLNEQQDGDANNNGYPDKTEKYQTLAQQGELPGLDPVLDTAHLQMLITTLQRLYEQVRYRRIDMSNFAQDVMDLYEKYKTETPTDIGAANQEHQAIHAEFKSMYPIAKTYSGWQGVSNDISSKIRSIYSLAKSVAKGDTSNYGYRVHPWQKSKGL
jgi:hypothetical protein